MFEVTNICIFCCRDCNEVGSSNRESEALNQNKKTKTLNQFVKLAERYLNTSFHLNTVNGNKGALELYRECCLVLESFCSSYHKLKCLEMELESKLRMLNDAINSSRSNSLCIREDGDFIKGLKSFRTDFQQKCIRQFSKSFPRVFLKRTKGYETKQEVCQLSNEVDADFNQLFLGWISTLAAVFLLGIGNLLQNPNEISKDTGEQHHILISELVDDDDHFEHDLTREDLSYYDITSNKDLKIEIPVNQLISRNTPDSESKCRKLLPPVSLQLNSNSVVNAKNRKLKSLKIKLRKKQRDDLSIQAQFGCFYCSRNFTSFLQLRRHRRAFTHALMKRKMLTSKQGNFKCLRKSKRQSKNSKLAKIYKSDRNGNVGVLRPLRNIRKQSVVNGSDVGSLESDDDESSCPSENDLSSCSSSSISSGEEFELSTCSFCDKKFKYLKRHQWKCRGNPDRLLPRCSKLTDPGNGVSNVSPCKPTTRTRDTLPMPASSLKVCDAEKNCYKTFENQEDLANHRKLHGKFACSFCPVSSRKHGQIGYFITKLATLKVAIVATFFIQIGIAKSQKVAILDMLSLIFKRFNKM